MLLLPRLKDRRGRSFSCLSHYETSLARRETLFTDKFIAEDYDRKRVGT
jgi:hypothetical protein